MISRFDVQDERGHRRWPRLNVTDVTREGCLVECARTLALQRA